MLGSLSLVICAEGFFLDLKFPPFLCFSASAFNKLEVSVQGEVLYFSVTFFVLILLYIS